VVNKYKTNNCGELRITDVNKEVRLAVFVQTIRNLGKMVFIDLRDEKGITQIVISEDANLENKMKDVENTLSNNCFLKSLISIDSFVERTYLNEISSAEIVPL